MRRDDHAAVDGDVQARADGVYITVDNSSGDDLYLDVGEYGRELRKGTTDLVIELDLGDVMMTCRPMPMGTVAEGDGTGGLSIEVVAPEGWVPAEVTCSSGKFSQGTIDYVAGARSGFRTRGRKRNGRPVPTWWSSRPGTRQAHSRTFAALDGDVVVKVYSFQSDGAGGWLLGGVSSCSEWHPVQAMTRVH